MMFRQVVITVDARQSRPDSATSNSPVTIYDIILLQKLDTILHEHRRCLLLLDIVILRMREPKKMAQSYAQHCLAATRNCYRHDDGLFCCILGSLVFAVFPGGSPFAFPCALCPLEEAFSDPNDSLVVIFKQMRLLYHHFSTPVRVHGGLRSF